MNIDTVMERMEHLVTSAESLGLSYVVVRTLDVNRLIDAVQRARAELDDALKVAAKR